MFELEMESRDFRDDPEYQRLFPMKGAQLANEPENPNTEAAAHADK